MGSLAATEPTLSTAEWHAVAVALSDASARGCGATDKPGAARRLLHALTGKAMARPLTDPKLRAVQRFLCETRRHRRIARNHLPALRQHGFNDRQLRALALLSA